MKTNIANPVKAFVFLLLLWGACGCVKIHNQDMQVFVFDAQTRQPIPDATVTVSYSSPGLPIANVPKPRQTVTNANGRAEITHAVSKLWHAWEVRLQNGRAFLFLPEAQWQEKYSPVFHEVLEANGTLMFGIPPSEQMQPPKVSDDT